MPSEDLCCQKLQNQGQEACGVPGKERKKMVAVDSAGSGDCPGFESQASL